MKHENELRNLAKELEDFNSSVGPITTTDFHQYVRERVQPIFTKYNKLYYSDYNRHKSLGYPLHTSKRAFKANKIFDIVYLKEVIEKSMPLADLESRIDDLKHHKENRFTDGFCKEMKVELPKLLGIVLKHVFDFEADLDEGYLFEIDQKPEGAGKETFWLWKFYEQMD